MGAFLDRWGSWFAVPRLNDGEADGPYARRIMTVLTASRNSKTAILAAVQSLVGPSAYMLEWFDVLNSWIYKWTPDPHWTGGDPAGHLIWGLTSRFQTNDLTMVPGQFEVWVPAGSGYTTAQIQAVVDRHKAAGTQGLLRYIA